MSLVQIGKKITRAYQLWEDSEIDSCVKECEFRRIRDEISMYRDLFKDSTSDLSIFFADSYKLMTDFIFSPEEVKTSMDVVCEDANLCEISMRDRSSDTEVIKKVFRKSSEEMIDEFAEIGSRTDNLLMWAYGIVDECIRQIKSAGKTNEQDWDQFLYEFTIYCNEVLDVINELIESDDNWEKEVGFWMEDYIYDELFYAFKNMKSANFFLSVSKYYSFDRKSVRIDRLKSVYKGEEKTISMKTFDDGVMDGIVFSLLDINYSKALIDILQCEGNSHTRTAYVKVAPVVERN